MLRILNIGWGNTNLNKNKIALMFRSIKLQTLKTGIQESEASVVVPSSSSCDELPLDFRINGGGPLWLTLGAARSLHDTVRDVF